MANSVYEINKGINNSIEFQGLRAQYILYLAAGLVTLLILFSILYLLGIPGILCIAVIGIAGVVLVLKIYAMSNKYGEHGMMKAVAKKSIPTVIKQNSRKVFKHLKR